MLETNQSFIQPNQQLSCKHNQFPTNKNIICQCFKKNISANQKHERKLILQIPWPQKENLK